MSCARCSRVPLVASFNRSAIGNDDTARGIELVERALANARDDAVALSLSSMMLIHNLRDYDRGLLLTQRAVEANPNNLTVMIFAGITHLHIGNVDDAIAFSEHAIRLSPSLDGAHWPLTAISHAHMVRGEYEEALSWAKRSLSANQSFVCTYWMLAAGNAHLGRLDEARKYLGTLQRLSPGVTVARIWAGQPQKDPTRLEAILDGVPRPLPMVFIRAPRILQVGAGVQVLARHGGAPVLVREGPVLAAAFHPELTDDVTVHRYFCAMAGYRALAGAPAGGGSASTSARR